MLQRFLISITFDISMPATSKYFIEWDRIERGQRSRLSFDAKSLHRKIPSNQKNRCRTLFNELENVLSVNEIQKYKRCSRVSA